ncbi:MAG: hypothetical protein OEV08_03730 [Nitrospira sp.]|nr:hypothetical protein [Nitrospira sp.]
MDESKRIKKLRGEVIKAIPKFPNNRETKERLEGMPLATLLIHYLNWMIRYVSVKPRKTIIEPTVTADPRWRSLRVQVKALLGRVQLGENLTPHLSIQPHSKGYSPETSKTGPDVDRWTDKDFLLNVMGFHHFHLGEKVEAAGHVERTDDVLFARVSREYFTAIGIFNHSVFEPAGDEMSDERKRLWKIFDEHTSRGVPPGSVVIPSHIATSGHPLHVVHTAQEYARIIYELDPKLDDPLFINELYGRAKVNAPEKIKLEWVLNFSDLGFHEARSNQLFVLRSGFN